MKDKITFIGILLITTTLFLSGCSSLNPSKEIADSSNDNVELENELKEKDIQISEMEAKVEELKIKNEELEIENLKIEDLQVKIDELENNQDEKSDVLLKEAIDVLSLLKNKDIDQLKEYIHPQKGVRFSAYPYVDLEKDLMFKEDEIVEKYNNSETYNWGSYDGKGSPIELSFKDYYDEFVYDEDFINAHIIRNNKIVPSGNTIENVKEAYPDGEFLEFYFEGFNEEYAGADWRSLKLVFENTEDQWYLVGIIHGQWTI